MEILLSRIPLIKKFAIDKEEKKEKEYNQALINDIEEIKRQIESVQTRFDMLSDGNLVEATIYEERALKARYAYLLYLARERKVYSEI